MLIAGATGPYLRLRLHGSTEFQVRVGHADGRSCFVWGAQHATHPLSDPSGCARRIVLALRTERGL